MFLIEGSNSLNQKDVLELESFYKSNGNPLLGKAFHYTTLLRIETWLYKTTKPSSKGRVSHKKKLWKSVYEASTCVQASTQAG